MKIAIASYRYPPDIGGIETVSKIIAEEAVKLGHSVRVVTTTRRSDGAVSDIPLIHPKSLWNLLKTFFWCDLVIQNNISVGLAWPAWILGKKQLIIHQTWIFPPGGRMKYLARIKCWLASFATQVAISRPIADQWVGNPIIAGNPYDSEIYQDRQNKRQHDLIFIGRLVEAKGAMILLDSLKRLRERGLFPHLTIVGDGPELSVAREYASAHLTENQVKFLGPKRAPEIAVLLNQHRILVVPSAWPEPFGIVALEGAGCGCAIVATKDGGLPDAAGPAALYAENRDPGDLADRLEMILRDPSLEEKMRSASIEHATRFQKHAYVDSLLGLVAKRGKSVE